ncbi:Uncharacterised protein [Mycobacteroides abscessus subsp. abscessus]|nr:Uncharacterised protein [Mycobacteroides abscessus subsp. abscessus]
MPYAPPTTKATATGAPKDGNRNPHHNSLATPAITAMTISPIQSSPDSVFLSFLSFELFDMMQCLSEVLRELQWKRHPSRRLIHPP